MIAEVLSQTRALPASAETIVCVVVVMLPIVLCVASEFATARLTQPEPVYTEAALYVISIPSIRMDLYSY